MRCLVFVLICLTFVVSCSVQDKEERSDPTTNNLPSSEGYRVKQGTVLTLGDLRIGVVNTREEYATLSLMIEGVGEKTIQVNVGETTVESGYQITNLGTTLDNTVGPWTPPGGDASFVLLNVTRAQQDRDDVRQELESLANPDKMLYREDILNILTVLNKQNAILNKRKVEVSAGVREEVGFNWSDSWAVGIDASKNWPVRVGYRCEDLCPQNGGFVMSYVNATPEDCTMLEGTPFLNMFGRYAGCRPTNGPILTTSVPQGDETGDEREPQAACKSLEDKYPSCKLASASRVDSGSSEYPTSCLGGGSIAGCFTCRFTCD